MIKRILKVLGVLLLSLIVLFFIVYLLMDKPLPNGVQGEDSERLADEMLGALNKPGFDSLEHIAFTFKGVHSYEWDKKEKKVRVKWGENDVMLDLSRSTDEYTMLEYKAYSFFINDSFWLIAPFKVRDQGVVRSTVDTETGRGLLVTYTSGGITPGDSYLWILDDNGFPIAWRLWTSIVPIGGLEFSWEEWGEYDDVWFSQLHQSSILNLDMTGVEVQ